MDDRGETGDDDSGDSGDGLQDIDGNANVYDVTPQMTPPPLRTIRAVAPEDGNEDEEEGQGSASSSAMNTSSAEEERGEAAGVRGGADGGQDALPLPPAPASSSSPAPALETTSSPISCETQQALPTAGVQLKKTHGSSDAGEGAGRLTAGWHAAARGASLGVVGGAQEEEEQLGGGHNTRSLDGGKHAPVSPPGDCEGPYTENQSRELYISVNNSNGSSSSNYNKNKASDEAVSTAAAAVASVGRRASEARRASELAQGGLTSLISELAEGGLTSLISATANGQSESSVVDGSEEDEKGEEGVGDDARVGGPLATEFGGGLVPDAVVVDAAAARETAGTAVAVAVEHGNPCPPRKSVDFSGDGMVLQTDPGQTRDSTGDGTASAARDDGRTRTSTVGDTDDEARGTELAGAAAGGASQGREEDGKHAVPLPVSTESDGVGERDSTVALLAVALLVGRGHRYDQATGRWSKRRSPLALSEVPAPKRASAVAAAAAAAVGVAAATASPVTEITSVIPVAEASKARGGRGIDGDDILAETDQTGSLGRGSQSFAQEQRRQQQEQQRRQRRRQNQPPRRQRQTTGADSSDSSGSGEPAPPDERLEPLESAVELTKTTATAAAATAAAANQGASSAAAAASVAARVAVENAARHAAFVRAEERQGRQSFSVDGDTEVNQAGAAGEERQERGRGGGEEGGLREEGEGERKGVDDGRNDGGLSDTAVVAAGRSNPSRSESKRQATRIGTGGTTGGGSGATEKEQEEAAAAEGVRFPQPRPSSLFVSFPIGRG